MESKSFFFRGSLDKANDLFSIPDVFNKNVMFNFSRGFGGTSQPRSELQHGHSGDAATLSSSQHAALG